MDFDRKTILAFVLIGLILILVNTDYYQRWLFGGKPIPNAPAAADSSSFERVPVEPPQAVAVPTVPVPALKSAEEIVRYAGTEWSRVATYTIETPLYVAEICTRGAMLRRFQLKNYLSPSREPVTVFADTVGSPSILLPVGEDTLDTGALIFSPTGRNLMLSGKDSTSLAFAHRLRDGQEIRKTFTFFAARYDVGLQVEFTDIRSLTSAYSYAVHWQSPLLSTEANIGDDMGHAKVYALVNRDLEQFDVGSDPVISNRRDDWITTWIAARTKYFATAIIPEGTNGNGLQMRGRSHKDAEGTNIKGYDYSLFMPLHREGGVSQRFKLFIGPLDYGVLKSYHADLQRMMDLGWRWVVEPFSVVVLTSFTAVHKVVPNYGLVIIIFSILVKLILNPLTRRSTRSMKEMQLLQPKIAELREKYASDPQRLNTETMKLYKEHGVNPLGGCLPTILQMPLLFALFVVFRSAIELRQAPFVLWIKDLSAPDTLTMLPVVGMPLNVLPLVMGATMFIQQKMTVTDPKQKFMLYFMPVMFTFMFYGFPSGLTLYYSLFNILSLVQQKYLSKDLPTQLEKKPAKPKGWKRLSLNASLARGRARK